jgi:hypothetical protein
MGIRCIEFREFREFRDGVRFLRLICAHERIHCGIMATPADTWMVIYKPKSRATWNFKFFNFPHGTPFDHVRRMAEKYGTALYKYDKHHDNDKCECFCDHWVGKCSTPWAIQKVTGATENCDEKLFKAVKGAGKKARAERQTLADEKKKRKAAEEAELAAVRKKYAAQ